MKKLLWAPVTVAVRRSCGKFAPPNPAIHDTPASDMTELLQQLRAPLAQNHRPVPQSTLWADWRPEKNRVVYLLCQLEHECFNCLSSAAAPRYCMRRMVVVVVKQRMKTTIDFPDPYRINKTLPNGAPTGSQGFFICWDLPHSVLVGSAAKLASAGR